MTNSLPRNSVQITTPKEAAAYVAERLKATRCAHHISLQVLSLKLGISRKQLQNYESAKSNITIIRLWEIAKLMNVDASFFIEGLSKKTPAFTNEDLRFIQKLHSIHNKAARQAIINLLNDF